MDFGEALSHIKAGLRVARSGWNGKGMWLVYTHDWTAVFGKGQSMPEGWEGYLPFIAMYTADKHLVPWLASQTDVLADDWMVVE